jgi:hypothetical protein
MESVSKPPPKPGKGDGEGGRALDRPAPARGGLVLAGDDDEELPSASALRAAAWDETQGSHRREKQGLEDRYRREKQELEDRYRREREELDERHRQELHQLFLQNQTPDVSRKRKRGEPSGAIQESCFGHLGQDCRLRILGFLRPEDLAEAAVVCKQLRDDCRDESLPQEERTAVIRIRPTENDRPVRYDRNDRIMERLVAMTAVALPDGRRKFAKFSRLRIVDHLQVFLDDFFERGPSTWGPPSGVTIPEITVLDWSVEEDPARANICRYACNHQSITLCKMGFVGMLPNLREVDFSDTGRRYLSFSFPMGGDRAPRLLEKIVWHGKQWFWGCDGLSEGFPCLREIYTDGSVFRLWSGTEPRVPLFFELMDRLERVSVKGARQVSPRLLNDKPLSQWALVEFVRWAPNLRWFRSDLTPENVAVLQRERPDVTFAP